MSGVLTNKRQIIRFPLLLVMVIVLAAIAIFAVMPSARVPETAIIPVSGNQSAYSEYLSGEKLIFAVPVVANSALSEYHLGEKALYMGMVSPNEALSLFRIDEKHVMSPLEYALLIHRAGEKEYR